MSSEDSYTYRGAGASQARAGHTREDDIYTQRTTTCQRCKKKLSATERQAPSGFKGGYQGYFCSECVSDFNNHYHAHPACRAYRAAEMQIIMLEKMASAQGADANVIMEKSAEVANKMSDAMKGLYDMTKEWATNSRRPDNSAPVPAPTAPAVVPTSTLPAPTTR